MRTFMKYFFGTLAAIVLLCIVTATLLIMFFPTERIRVLAEERGSEALNMPVSIGELGLTFLGLPAIQADNITIGPAPGMTEPLASLAVVRIRVNLLKLFRREIEIVSADIREPVLNLVIAASDTAIGEDPAVSADPGGPSLPVPLTLKSFSLHDGTVRISDPATGMRMTLTEIGLQFSLDVGRDFTALTTTGTLDIGDISLQPDTGAAPITGVDASFRYALTGDPFAGNFTLDTGDLAINDLPLRVTGSLNDWTSLEFAVATGTVDVAGFITALPRSLVPEADKVAAEGTFSLTVDGTADFGAAPPSIAYSGSLALDMNGLAYVDFPRAIDTISLELAFTEEQLTITRSSIVTGGSELTITGTADQYLDDPEVDLTIAGGLDAGELAASLPAMERLGLGGMIALNLRIAGTPSDASSLAARGQVRLDDFRFAMPKLLIHPAAFQGQIEIAPEMAAVRELRFTSGVSDLTFDGSLQGYQGLLFPETGGIAQFTGTLASDLMDINDLLVLDSTAPVPKPWDLAAPAARLPIPPTLNAVADIDLHTVRFARFVMDGVSGKVSLRDRVFSLENLNVTAYGGALTGSTTLIASEPEHVTYSGSFALNSFEAGRFLADMFNTGEFMEGTLATTLSFSGAGLDSAAMVDNLTASGTMRFADGAFNNWEFTRKLGETIGFLDFDTLAFDTITNTFSVRDHRVITPDMALNAGAGRFTLDGSAGFDSSLDYTLAVVLNQDASQQVLRHISSLSQYIDVPVDGLMLDIAIGGTIGTPTFTLDTSRARTWLQERARQELRSRAEDYIDSNIQSDDLREEGRQLLEKLLE